MRMSVSHLLALTCLQTCQTNRSGTVIALHLPAGAYDQTRLHCLGTFFVHILHLFWSLVCYAPLNAQCLHASC